MLFQLVSRSADLNKFSICLEAIGILHLELEIKRQQEPGRPSDRKSHPSKENLTATSLDVLQFPDAKSVLTLYCGDNRSEAIEFCKLVTGCLLGAARCLVEREGASLATISVSSLSLRTGVCARVVVV